MIPVAILGLFFKSDIEQFFEGDITLVGIMLCLTGILLLFTHLLRNREGGEVTFGRALVIGIAQAVAILPGISRSGATICTAILIGTDRSKAAKFSFLMVLLPIIGATILEMQDYLKQSTTHQDLAINVLIIGFLASFLSGLVACRLMIELVKKGKLIYFAIYCFIVGLIAILV
jgi:undecaprenyl-diphosphatase